MGDVWGEEEDAENKEENKVEKGCPGEPLCVTSTFEAMWRVVGTEAAAELSDRSKLTFGQRSAAIMPGLAYQLQAGYAGRVRGNLMHSPGWARWVPACSAWETSGGSFGLARPMLPTLLYTPPFHVEFADS